MKLPAFTNGGQHGVIVEDRRLRRAGAKEGTPSSKNLSDWFPAFAGMTECGCYVIHVSNLFSTTVTDVMPLKNGIHLRIRPTVVH